jgi:ABC-type dipeptide/oligopeptide/nickel transport system permease component
MRKYIIRRLLLAIPVLLLASLVMFGLMRVMPGDALTALMAESGNVSERDLQKLRKDLEHPFGTDDIGRDVLSRVI